MNKSSIPRLSTKTEPFKFVESLEGKTKKNFEMVISRYDEDVSWCKNYMDFVTIYNKGDDINYDYIKLENKGHLADTILRHIITNYDNLADVTFFTHGSFNYRSDQVIKEQGRCHRKFQEFITTDQDTLVCIPRYDLPGKNDTFYDYHETVADVYHKIFGETYSRNFPWACGKWISVSREKIRKTPVSTYGKMLAFVLNNHDNKEPSQHIYRTRGIYIERFILKCFL
tara:strand:- start:2081 stop:2761 length:681 start_codon:yes stop_codon:yes gene_type:complete